ncbi:MAG: nuclear transport factor 2 family protein [Cyclobacteriaceae bacterium]
MRTQIFLTAIACALFCITFNGLAQPDNLAEAKLAIEASNAVYFKAFVKNDRNIFIERYAEDCCIMAPGMPAMCGSSAPREFFRMAYEEFGLRNGKFITQEVYGDGKEFVTEVGLWQSFDEHGVLYDDGKFLVLWKKTAKGWKMYRDSFSSNRAIDKQN